MATVFAGPPRPEHTVSSGWWPCTEQLHTHETDITTLHKVCCICAEAADTEFGSSAEVQWQPCSLAPPGLNTQCQVDGGHAQSSCTRMKPTSQHFTKCVASAQKLLTPNSVRVQKCNGNRVRWPPQA